MQINMYGKAGEDKGFSYQSLIDRVELQRLQDEFCAVTGIYVYCVNAEGEPQTEMSGSREGIERIKNHVSEELVEQAVIRVAEGSLEDFVVEETNVEDVRLSAISVRIEGKTVLTWVAYGVVQGNACSPENKELSGMAISEKAFYDGLDLLRDASITLFRNKLLCVSAEAESMRSRYSESRMSETLERIEAMTSVIQLLDSNEVIESVMGKALSIVGKHLDVSSAQIYQVYGATGRMDVVHEWLAGNVVSVFEKTKDLEAFGFLDTEKPLVLGSDSMMGYSGNQEFFDMHIRAAIVFPLMKSGENGMYICLNQVEQNRIWQVEEIKFISEAVRVLQSILTKRIQKNSLASSYASLEMVLDNVGCCIFVRDISTGRMLFANRQLKNTFAQELKDGYFPKLVEKALPAERKPGFYEMSYFEREQWYDLLFTQITWVDGRQVELFSIYDITDKKVYQRKIEQQAYTDFLTGLYNRMCCERDLAWHIDDARKHGVKGGLLYLDLDDFKHINDGLGHQYGDVLLKSISSSLQRIDGIRTTCYRMGGDEFVIVIPPESYPRFEQILEDIRRIFMKPWFLKDADYYCTMSMGIVTFPDDGENVQDLIKKADIAMYEAKKAGKNRMEHYCDSLESASGRRLDMEKNMRDATVSGFREFEVYYQPIIDISREGLPCTGAEALIRWNSTELGFIPPADFIPLAEYLGLINPIGNHVLFEACKACKYWNDHGYPGYKVNVNLSVVQLLQADIVDIVEKTLKDTGIRPHNLTLEVTESLAINDMDRMKEILANIKKLGVRIALDDFGTGYSSLNHIREIPFDVIKVDQSFVKDLAEDAYSQSFIKMVAELAETIGVSICVEGIEREEQYKVLEGMKVRLVQGFYFDRPMVRKEFEHRYCK